MSPAAKKPDEPRGRLRWGRRTAVGLFIAGALLLLWVATAQPRLGVPRQHEYPYRPRARWSALNFLALMAVPAGLALAWTLTRHRELGRREQWLLVAAITVGCLILRFGAAYYTRSFPGAELGWPFLWKSTEGAYAAEVRRVATVRSFLGSYADQLAESGTPGRPHRVHLDTHPPGIVLGFVALESFYDARPKLAKDVADWTERNLPTSKFLTVRQAYAIRHPLAVAMTATLLSLVLASLMPLAAFATARQLLPGEPAVVATGLCALLTGTYLFSPSVDQVYPLLTLLLCATAVRAAARRSVLWGLATGLVLYGVAFVHVGFGLVMVVLALAALVAWREGSAEEGGGIRTLAAVCRRPAVGLLAGFLIPTLLLRLWAGYPTLRVIWLCARNNGRFYAEAGRTYWPWLPITPLEFVLSFGVGAAVVLVVGWLFEVRGVVRRRSLVGASSPLLVAGTVLAALYLAGAARGEAARLWLFLMPLAMLGVVDFLWQRLRDPRPVLAAVVGLQLVQVVVLPVVLDLAHTTTFFWNIVRPG